MPIAQSSVNDVRIGRDIVTRWIIARETEGLSGVRVRHTRNGNGYELV